MTNLIVEISKYVMILLMAVYTYANFRYFSVKDEAGEGICRGRTRLCSPSIFWPIWSCT